MMIHDNYFKHEPIGELRALIGDLSVRFRGYIRRARAYRDLAFETLAKSDEGQFPILRKWLHDTESIYTPDQQAERLYDDALRQLLEAENSEHYGFAPDSDD